MRQQLVFSLILLLLIPLTALAAQDSVASLASEAAGGLMGIFGGLTLEMLEFILSYVNLAISFIGGAVFVLAGLFIQTALLLNATILDNEWVLVGWRIVRDLANLGFVIAIIIIAFATMLQLENYGAKKMLVILVMAAVLINFSLAIAGVFIDFSNVFTALFVKKAIGGGSADAFSLDNLNRFAGNLAYAFSPQKLLETNDNPDIYKSIGTSMAGMISLFASTFFLFLFTTLAALSMLAIALMLLVRYVNLSLLLILLPGAVLALTLPKMEKYWSLWVNKFFSQIIYLPAATFFIYLTIIFVDLKAQAEKSGMAAESRQHLAFLVDQQSGNAFSGFLGLMAQPFAHIAQMIVVIFILTLGMKTAAAVGDGGAAAIVGMFNTARGWVMGQVKGRAKQAGGLAARAALRTGGPEKGLGARMTNLMARIPGLRRLAAPLQGFISGSKENIDRYAKEYEQMGKQGALNIARSPGLLGEQNPERRTALARVIAEKGWLSEEGGGKGLTAKEFEPFLTTAEKWGVKKEDLLRVAPQLYSAFGYKSDPAELDKLVAELYRTDEDVDKISAGALENLEIVSRLTSQQTKRIIQRGSYEKRRTLIRTLNRLDEPLMPVEMSRKLAIMVQGFKNLRTTPNLSGIREVPDLITKAEAAAGAVWPATTAATPPPTLPLPPAPPVPTRPDTTPATPLAGWPAGRPTVLPQPEPTPPILPLPPTPPTAGPAPTPPAPPTPPLPPIAPPLPPAPTTPPAPPSRPILSTPPASPTAPPATPPGPPAPPLPPTPPTPTPPAPTTPPTPPVPPAPPASPTPLRPPAPPTPPTAPPGRLAGPQSCLNLNQPHSLHQPHSLPRLHQLLLQQLGRPLLFKNELNMLAGKLTPRVKI